jgi:hypothetical protein
MTQFHHQLGVIHLLHEKATQFLWCFYEKHVESNMKIISYQPMKSNIIANVVFLKK